MTIGEPFKGTEVSRKSAAALIVDLIRSPSPMAGRNVGVNRPKTDGDEPVFL